MAKKRKSNRRIGAPSGPMAMRATVDPPLPDVPSLPLARSTGSAHGAEGSALAEAQGRPSIVPEGSWPAGYGPGERNDPERGTCCLCGNALDDEWGNNPAPLAEDGRCCNRCNRDKVVPARLDVIGNPGRTLAQRSSAHQGDLPGARHPGEAAAEKAWQQMADDVALVQGESDLARRIVAAEGEDVATWQTRRGAGGGKRSEQEPKLTDALGTPYLPSQLHDRDDLARVLMETATEPGYSGTGLAGATGSAPTGASTAPPVRTAADVAELRNWLVRQWQPGGLYARATRRAADRGGTEQARQRFVAGERQQLQRADLYWVAPAMCDLLEGVAPEIPGDVRPEDLPWPAQDGFVVFARPLVSTDALNGEHLAKWVNPDEKVQLGALAEPREAIEVNAIVWSNVRIPDSSAPGGRVVCLGVSSYRMLDFGAGLGPQELALATGTGAIDGAVGTKIGTVETGPAAGSPTMNLTGTVWAPMGRSDWPIASRADTQQHWIPDGAWPSFLEDRQRIAALFTLLEQRNMVTTAAQPLPRPAVRRAQRLGVAKPRDVVVVTLRQPKRAHNPNGEAVPVQHDHRWLVRAHPRWQACGPGRAERKLIVVRAHVKGPEDAPLRIKTRVNAWVR